MSVHKHITPLEPRGMDIAHSFSVVEYTPFEKDIRSVMWYTTQTHHEDVTQASASLVECHASFMLQTTLLQLQAINNL